MNSWLSNKDFYYPVLAALTHTQTEMCTTADTNERIPTCNRRAMATQGKTTHNAFHVIIETDKSSSEISELIKSSEAEPYLL